MTAGLFVETTGLRAQSGGLGAVGGALSGLPSAAAGALGAGAVQRSADGFEEKWTRAQRALGARVEALTGLLSESAAKVETVDASLAATANARGQRRLF